MLEEKGIRAVKFIIYANFFIKVQDDMEASGIPFFHNFWVCIYDN